MSIINRRVFGLRAKFHIYTYIRCCVWGCVLDDRASVSSPPNCTCMCTSVKIYDDHLNCQSCSNFSVVRFCFSSSTSSLFFHHKFLWEFFFKFNNTFIFQPTIYIFKSYRIIFLCKGFSYYYPNILSYVT